jgi:hypothetical protein
LGDYLVNKKYAGFIVCALLVIFGALLIANIYSNTRDVSWINEVEDLIKKENWVADSEYIPMQDWAFFIYENGEGQYFLLKSNEEFISHINDLMNRIDRQIEESISDESFDEILATDKVLAVVHRFSTKSSFWNAPNNFGMNVDYDKAYFILEDKLGEDLEGTIIVREHSMGEEDYRYSVWQIINSFLW